MSDRVVLMRRGRIAQEDTPQALFERPNSSFVGSFMGVENALTGVVKLVEPGRVVVASGGYEFAGAWTGTEPPSLGQRVVLMIRAEKVQLRTDTSPRAGMVLRGRVVTRVYKGKYTDTIVETPVGAIHARAWNQDQVPSDHVEILWNEASATIAPETKA
jgi:ABC-type Fe3+/spermidine/putrescine transport system ATPase subunit